MSRDGARTRIDDVTATAAMVDGRVSMDAERIDAALSVVGRDRRPLSAAETHVRLELTADGVTVGVRLDGEQADALREALDTALSWEGRP